MWTLPSVYSEPPWQRPSRFLRPKHRFPALRRLAQAAVRFAIRIARELKRSQIFDHRLDLIRRRFLAAHRLNKRVAHQFIKVFPPTVPSPRSGLRHAAQSRHFLMAEQVRGAEILPTVVQGVENQAARVPVRMASGAAIPLMERPRRVMEEDFPLSRERRRFRTAELDRADDLGRFGVDDLDAIAKIIGDIKRFAVEVERQLRRPAADRDAAKSTVLMK